MRFSLILVIGLFASCSSEDGENNTTQNTTQSTNNTTSTNNKTNNRTNNTTNNTTVGTTGGTTSQTTSVPDPYAFTCDEFTPAGDLDVVSGNWDIKDLCFFENPFAAFSTFCPDIVFTDFEVTETEGRVIVDLPNFALVDFSKVDVDLYLPKDCVDRLGNGTCEGTKGRIDTLITADVTCVESTADACECNIKGEFGARRTGTLEFVSPGVAKTWEFDDEGKVVEDEIQYALTDQGGIFATGENMDILKVESGAAPTLCETYCTTFLATCNNAPDVEAYVDGADCAAKCALFPSTGSPDVLENSVECRIRLAQMGADGTNIDNFATHCKEAQNIPTSGCIVDR